MLTNCKTWRVLVGLTLVLLANVAGASADAVDTIRNTIHARFPQLKVIDVRPGPAAGLYEVFTGSQLVYSDATGDHLFVGKLIDTHTRRDLAEEQLENRLTIDFQTLPFERAIKVVKGNGAQRLALFEDPVCPYCQQLERELASLNDVTLYVFLFPLAELHPQARVHAHAIWCAPDRAGAWTHWMLERQEPKSVDCADDPIDQLQSLGNELNVSATPTLFLANGQRYQGVIPAAKLQELLQTTSRASSSAANHPEISSATSTAPAYSHD